MQDALILDIIEVLVKHKVVPDIFLRDERIKSEYKYMRDQGMAGKAARESLAEKYCTSIKTVESALYGKKKKYE